jgi:hypothetical protein
MAEAKFTIDHVALAADVKLLDLAQLRDVLRGLVAACDKPHGAACPIIEQLEASPRSSVSVEMLRS